MNTVLPVLLVFLMRPYLGCGATVRKLISVSETVQFSDLRSQLLLQSQDLMVTCVDVLSSPGNLSLKSTQLTVELVPMFQ